MLPVRRVLVSGPSMVPTLRTGDTVLVLTARWPGVRGPRPGDVVLARFRSMPDRLVLKRAVARDGDGWTLASDNPFAGGDSTTHGVADVLGRVVVRRPAGRRRVERPAPAPPGEPTAGQVPPGEPTAGQAPPGEPTAGQAPPGEPTAGQAPPGKPTAGQAHWWAPVQALVDRLSALGWVSDVWVAGSAASGDHRPGVSDLDLVAVVDGPIGAARHATLTALHRELEAGPAAGTDLGCAYVDAGLLPDAAAVHPTWTHGRWAARILSGITRAELARFGIAVLGRPPADLLPPVGADAVRQAARAELTGYWAAAARRPWWWLDPVLAELGLTAMARGRYAIQTGELLTKSAAVDHAEAPPWLVARLQARRAGVPVPFPRLRGGLLAWLDARRTVRLARRAAPAEANDGA